MLWHPFMPFVTEYIWQTANFGGILLIQVWPKFWTRPTMALENFPNLPPLSQASKFGVVKEIITDFRRIRNENGIDPGSFIVGATGPAGPLNTEGVTVTVGPSGSDLMGLIKENEEIIKGMAKISELRFGEIPEGWPMAMSGTLAIGLERTVGVDAAKEKAKMQKEIDQLKPYIKTTEARLADKDFTSKAPEKVVASMQAKLDEAKAKLAALEQRLISL